MVVHVTKLLVILALLGSLSTGIIVGIIVGTVAVVLAAVVGIVIIFCIVKLKQSEVEPEVKTGMYHIILILNNNIMLL